MNGSLGSGDPIFAEERRQRILAMVGAQGRVRIAELVAVLGVSEPTIRKDLSLLELGKQLRRTHGGAIALRPQFEPTIDDRSMLHAEAKDLIARACAAEIAPGDSVFLDSGTTVQRIAHLLDQEHVNVLTNSLGVAAALADKPPSIRHTLLGGTVHSLGGTVVGPIALETLSRFTVNLAFISSSGLTESGISVAEVAETQVKQAVIDRARKVVVPIDSSKFGVTDFITVCGLDRVDLVVTEDASEEIRELCADNGVELKVVGAGRS
ncbi:DeoR/GlpR family DNA-binding transcription regulator [Actinospica sp.]|jgi:DeoR family fructose operon transcriptional repressor|uniref:DeoR/GlpR family DNA-binding transcription regulator n=1 Tax=Actinospica sp. TaxID=1872142 RepID=UPI002C25CC44|nr:DeoR/GlpR family DNA-binding transcription regulator [Actinospica sp.]HWG24865.1 DeoR/GlpR family DNA-binding transcription regulator [Actinospica sp.]